MDYDKIKAQYKKRRDKIRAMANSGMTAKQIATKLRISKQRVYVILKADE